MKLRTIIFLVLLALGILPILTLVGVNLRAHIRQHGMVEKKRTAAGVESSFAALNTRIKCVKKSLLQVAATPMMAGISIDSRLRDTDRKRLAALLIRQIDREKVILGVSIHGADGRPQLQLGRDAASRLTPLAAGPGKASATLVGQPDYSSGEEARVDAILPQKQPDFPVRLRLELVTPIIDEKGHAVGTARVEIAAELFLDNLREACWINREGTVLYPPAVPLSGKDQPPPVLFADLAPGSGLFGLFPGLKEQMKPAQPLVWELDSSHATVWLPLIFNPTQGPVLWLGSPIDRSAAQQWQQSLIYNIVGIVLAIAVVVALIANAIAGKIDRIQSAILSGLDAILNRGAEAVRFHWTGPREVVNLAEELTSLAAHYAATRKMQIETETALRQSEDKFRNLTASAQDAIALMDHLGNISYWNKAAVELFGYREEEALGRPIHALIAPSLAESAQREADAPGSTDDGPIRETIELITRRKDGSEVPVELSLSEARIKGRWNSIWIIRDITERKRAEEETKLQQQQLIQADKMISLGVLVSGVAHEINNPNSIAMLNTSLLGKSWESARPILEEYYRDHGDFNLAGLPYSEMQQQIPRLFSELEESGRRIKNIVHDLKDYARRDSSRPMEAVDLNQVVQAAVRLNHTKLKQATRNLTLELAANLPPIRGNRQRLEQVLINLIQNSCEALQNQEAAVALATGFDPDKMEVIVTVSDEGEGISPELLNRITDPFFTTKRTYGGTGLGLSVSAGIVKEHGGEMLFSSIPGKGTTVRLSFALAKEQP